MKISLYTTLLLILLPLTGRTQATRIGDDILARDAETSHGFRLALSADGRTLAISTVEDDNPGYLRVYERNQNGWEQLGQILFGAPETTFGIALALSADGRTLAVGAPNHEVNEVETGLARVYRLVDDAWVPLGQDLLGDEVEVKAGLDVDLADNGNMFAVTSYGSANGQVAGTVRTYVQAAGLWVPVGNGLQGQMIGAGAQTTARLSGDGSRLAINRPLEGEVRVYEWDNAAWVPLGDPIMNDGTDIGIANRIELSEDGAIVAIGAPASDLAGNARGAIHTYALESGAWQSHGNPITGLENGDRFGASFGMTGDGRTILAATPGLRLTSDPPRAGEASLYRFEGSDWATAGEPIHGENIVEIAGLQVALSADGRTMAMTMATDAAGVFVRAFDLSGLSTSVSAMPLAKPLKLYPNPTAGRVTLAGLPPAERVLSTRLLNLAGQVVREESSDRRQLRLGVNSGTYIVEVTTTSGRYSELLTVAR
ncbi:putative secreted protein (Por secretion system target) [Neolewinella xylanilytica]|uniref:Putative secreted protein (Por secretion system target) n=1 Tax=Neolewinella xylanilytica TaxID=1514080 RepID=A0A2S6I7B2_9BACT|nr:T9SS type A sorting domain-containing protein [Neolewinella xylanilytica]PPK87401.1 putative secreted protein (Por secretion system target) [Neolewinella xylanilytica]